MIGFNLFFGGWGVFEAVKYIGGGYTFLMHFCEQVSWKILEGGPTFLPALPLAGVQQCKQDNKINIWNKMFFNTADTLLYKRD